MGRVLFAWELGGGLGHMVNCLPLVRGLIAGGHDVWIALRDLTRAESIFGGSGAKYLQAPYRPGRMPNAIDVPHSFAQILFNVGFGHPAELHTITEAWRNIYDLICPDLIVLEHSPSALLAARGYSARVAQIGSGFFLPIDEYPLRDLRPWRRAVTHAQLQCDEDHVTQYVNRQLLSWGAPPIERLTSLYTDIDEVFLMTFEELDHYPDRKGMVYRGALPYIGGKLPEWPDANGPRVYAYFKPFAAIENVLSLLNEIEVSTLVSADGVPPYLQERYASRTMRFETDRLDLADVAKQCDMAIMNGNHFTTASMLLAGKPTMSIPLYLEQSLFSDAVVRLGAGLKAPADRPELIAVRILSMLSSDQFADAACAFAERYEQFDAAKTVAEMLVRTEELIAAPTAIRSK